MEHTPGPWKISDDGRTIVNPKPCGRAGNCDGQIARVGGLGILDNAAGAANAKLIAASPDLLAALRELLSCPDLNYDELDECTDIAIDNARAAIAKVEGGK